MAQYISRRANRISMLSTLADAAFAFARGRKKSGVLLLAAAALSTRIHGVGTLVSVFLRLVRWFR